MDLQLLTSDSNLINWNDILNVPADTEPYTRKDGLNGMVY